MTQRIAFIGLGNMGGPMAANLARKGFDVCAFDLAPSALQQAGDAGCRIAPSPRDAIANADFVITMLPTGKIVESLLIDDDKLLDAIPETALVIDSSTVSPDNSRRIAREAIARGLHFIDAPVSGGTAAAAAGTLSFMCGGDAADVERAKTVLSAMGANVFHAGDHGAGSVAKICNNMLLAIHMIGTAEALQLGVNNGLDPKVLSNIMLKSSGCNWSLEKYNPYPGVLENVPSSRNYQGGFLVNLMLKDLGLAMEVAENSHSKVAMGRLADELYQQHRQQKPNNGALDFSSILQLFNPDGAN
jgi:3-hydroxyisobutyrate dehydrogenase